MSESWGRGERRVPADSPFLEDGYHGDLCFRGGDCERWTAASRCCLALSLCPLGGISFAPRGAGPFSVHRTHGLRRGLHSFAVSRLDPRSAA